MPGGSRARRKVPRDQRRAKIGRRALELGDRRVPLFSGAMHYFRHDPDTWPGALRALRALGLEIVETYVPWGTHELGPGEYDFGERDPRLDLGRFLDLVAQEGLLAFVRPGPHINAELTYFGLPERIVYDKACQARSPRQNPVILPWPPRMFPVPSYASVHYLGEAGRWYDAVGAIVGPRIWPAGPVALLQVDNEAAYYFRNGPYDQDYHPDAVALFREHLAQRYGTLAETSRAHRSPYRAWEDVMPPERFAATRADELVVHLDWARFQEVLISTAVGRMRDRMHAAGMAGAPTVHNVPLGESGLPVNVPALGDEVDLCGLDYYHAAREHRTIKRRTLLLAGTFDLPYAPELGVGAPPWFTPLAHEDSLYTAMCALAWGLRGFNLYMAVDRDRWYGAPVDANGRERPEAEPWRRLLAALSQISFHELERKAQVALVVPQEYRRLSRATHLLGGLVSPSAMEAIGGTPVDACREDAFGFKGPIQVLWWRMLAKVSDALTRAGIPYVYVDSETRGDALGGYALVVAPSYEMAAPERWEVLCAAAERGARVVYGPALPELDPSMHPSLFDEPEGGRRVLLDTAQDAELLVAGLVEELGLASPFRATPAPVETSVHEDAVGPRALFVMNPSRAPVKATVQVPAPMVLEDALSGERITAQTEARVELGPTACRLFVIAAQEPARRVKSERRPRARRRKA